MPVLNHVNFTVEAGERIAIIGANGIGKTTLMRCLAGDLTPHRGTISWVENAERATCRRTRRPSSTKDGPVCVDVAIHGQGR